MGPPVRQDERVREPADVEVRRAGAQDLLSVLAVHAHRDPGVDPPVCVTAQQQRTWDEMMSRDGLAAYVAELRGKPVGTATVVLMPNLTYQCAYRRQGIATSILNQVLEDARTAGCNKIQLLSHKRHADDGGHDLYFSLGFEPEAEGFRRYLLDGPAFTRGSGS
jgi:ribosomal protein S18 acetylase RimI-like enzyme